MLDDNGRSDRLRPANANVCVDADAARISNAAGHAGDCSAIIVCTMVWIWPGICANIY